MEKKPRFDLLFTGLALVVILSAWFVVLFVTGFVVVAVVVVEAEFGSHILGVNNSNTYAQFSSLSLFSSMFLNASNSAIKSEKSWKT